jgi:hypothetical protein
MLWKKFSAPTGAAAGKTEKVTGAQINKIEAE